MCDGDSLSTKTPKTFQQNKAYQKPRSPLPTGDVQRAHFRIIVYFPDEIEDGNFNPCKVKVNAVTMESFV